MKQFLYTHEIRKHLAEVEKELIDLLTFEPKFISEKALAICRAGGKRIRPAFLIAVAKYYNKLSDDVITAAALMEIIHMSSLIHDDINDDAELRRGEVTLNEAYNNAFALHIGDFLLLKAMKAVLALPYRDRIIEILADVAEEMALGEVAQLRSSFDLSQTRKDYYYRIERKTALLIAISCQIGAILSDATPEDEELFYKFGYHLGMAFQIKDDLLDILEQGKDIGKPSGQDLYNGLLNLPVLFVLEEDHADKEELVRLIEDAFPEKEDMERAIDIIKAHGGIEKSEKEIKYHINQAKSYIDQLPQNKMQQLLKEGADFVYERAY